MTQKRRGLGKGLGALIPTGPDDDRPVNVFFPGGSDNEKSGSQDRKKSRAERAETATRRDSDEELAVTAPEAGEEKAGEEPAKDGHRAPDSPAPKDLKEAPGEAGKAKPKRQVGTVIVEPVKQNEEPQSSGDVSRETSEGSAAALSEALGAADSTGELLPVPGARFAELSIDTVEPNSRQPRTVFDEGELAELVGSIKEVGVLQPIVVRPAREPGKYELIMGERRLRAAKEAELGKIPAIIRETEDADMLRDALLENLHRTNLNPLEEAAAYQQLLEDFGCTHEELADRIARSRPQISNTLRLLKLPPLVQRRVAAGVLSAGHARALLGLDDGAAMERLAQKIVAEGLSVRATEEIVALGVPADKKKRQPRPGQRSEAIDALAARLSDRFDTRVRVNLGKNKGRLTVEFASVEDLNRILDVLAPSDPGLLRP